jgi:hypothetical protein
MIINPFYLYYKKLESFIKKRGSDLLAYKDL